MRQPCLVIFIVLSAFSLAAAEKLNERRVLLPFNSGVPTNFTLEALSTTACYKWSSSRPDVASVRHLDDPSCSRRAIVTVVSRVASKRQSTVVTAQNLKSNVQIRCDVEVDSIRAIQIRTTTKKIVFGELPEEIKVFALDAQGDIFTSIGGVQFDWLFSPLDVIRYRPWASSSYASPDFVEYWEARGAKSSYVLVEGIKTGVAKIATKIIGDAFGDVKPAEITVHVVANLRLIPSNDVFLVRGAKVGFRAEIAKQGPRSPLNLTSSSQYYLEVIDPAIAMFDTMSNQLEALTEGQTSLVLKDRNVAAAAAAEEVDEEDGEEGVAAVGGDDSAAAAAASLSSQTSTDIHVMRPSYISIEVTPGEKFELRNDTVYIISLTLHDDWHHRLYSAGNLHMSCIFPETHFDILQAMPNGTYFVVRTKQTGTGRIKATFLGAGNVEAEQPLLEHVQEVAIYPPITLEPSHAYLPWLPTINPKYTVRVAAFGGTGEYSWTSANDSLATVRTAGSVGGDKTSASGSSLATIYTFGGEQAQVDVACHDVHNGLMFNALMTIQVRPIEAIEVLPSIVEANVGGNILLPVALLGTLSDGKKFYFNDCDHVDFEVEIVEKHRITYRRDELAPGIGRHSCRSLTFECMASGNSRIWITYGTGEKRISTSAIVGCFTPLKLVHPPEVAVLALGAAIDLAFEGGPRPWPMSPESHAKVLTPSTSSSGPNADDIVKFKELKDPYRYNKDLHLFQATCTSYGETTLELEVANRASPTLKNPATTKTTVKIICARPETLIIRPNLKKTCPQQENTFTLEKSAETQLDVVVLDGQGRAFYNFSTFHFDWSTDGDGVFKTKTGVLEEVNGAKTFMVLTRSYQQLDRLTSRRSKVQARIGGYKHDSSYFADRFDVKRNIELILVDKLETSEESVSILKHTDYKKSISIAKGSGHFSIEWTSKENIDVEVPKDSTSNRHFEIKPKQLGNGILTISDLCLTYPPISVYYSVVEAIDIRVEVVDKIQLGGQTQARFSVIDNRGERLPSSLHALFDFGLSTNVALLTVGEIKTIDERTSGFLLKAERLGVAQVSIYSQATTGLKPIRSAPLEVQIFSPLTITPANITLMVGNYFQAGHVGGPHTSQNVEFSVDRPEVATVTSSGLLQAHRHGRLRLKARVMGANNVEYSRAEMEVVVRPLVKVKISAPITAIMIGAEVPIHLVGVNADDESPFMFGHAQPALRIDWGLSNDRVATLEHSLHRQQPLVGGDQISARFRARALGSVQVKVRVQVLSPADDAAREQVVANDVLTDILTINVLSDYALSRPSRHSLPPAKLVAPSLLLTPNADLVLHYNHLDRIAYRLINLESDGQLKLINGSSATSTATGVSSAPVVPTQLILKAGDQTETGTLVVARDVHRTGEMQYHSYSVHVCKARYLSLDMDPADAETLGKNFGPIEILPLGVEVRLYVTYFDALGSKFEAVKGNLRWQLSRSDVIGIVGVPGGSGGGGVGAAQAEGSMAVLKVRALREGQVILRLVDVVNQVGTFLKIKVAPVIEPMGSGASGHRRQLVVKVSDLVCLRSHRSVVAGVADGGGEQENEDNDRRTNLATGLWSLEDGGVAVGGSKVGYISASAGTFVALNSGRTLITYNASRDGLSGAGNTARGGGSGDISTYTNLLVAPLERIHLDTRSVVGVTTTSPLVLPIIVGGVQPRAFASSPTTSAIVSPEVLTKHCTRAEIDSIVRHLRSTGRLPFTCDVVFNTLVPATAAVWSTEVTFEPASGRWQCKLLPKAELDLVALSMFDTNVTVTVLANIEEENEEVEANDENDEEGVADLRSIPNPTPTFHQVVLPFLPAFQTSVRQLILTSEAREVRFTITSVRAVLEELVIKVSNDDILEVTKLAIVDNGLKVAVRLRNANIFSNDVSNLHLMLASAQTNQAETIGVQIKLYGTLQELPAQLYSTNFWYSATVVLLTLLMASLLVLVGRKLVTNLVQGGGAGGGGSGWGQAVNDDNKSPYRVSTVYSPNRSYLSGTGTTSISPNSMGTGGGGSGVGVGGGGGGGHSPRGMHVLGTASPTQRTSAANLRSSTGNEAAAVFPSPSSPRTRPLYSTRQRIVNS